MAIALSCENPAANAADPSTVDRGNDMSATDVLEAMIRSRDKLHAGTCRARWKWQTTQYKEAVNWSFYFDYDKGWSRIDRQVIHNGREVIRIIVPTEIIDYVPGPSGTITRLNPGAPALADSFDFDIRDTGVAPLISVQGNAATWENFLTMVKRDGPPVMRHEDGGEIKLTFEHTEPLATKAGKFFRRTGYSFWLDPKLQLSPVHAEFFQGTAREAAAIDTRASCVVETEWIVRDAAPVPRHCKWTLPIHQQSAELTFEWISVNRSVPPALFTAEGLNPPKGTQIINSKLGESFIESIVGEEPPQKQSSLPRKNTRTFAIIEGATVCALVAAGRLWKRRGISGVDSAGFSSGR